MEIDQLNRERVVQERLIMVAGILRETREKLDPRGGAVASNVNCISCKNVK